MRIAIIVCCAAATLIGCAGRDARPVSVIQTRDTDMSCQAIKDEVHSSTQRITSLSKEKSSAKSSNVAVGVVGATIFPPALFALDTSDAEDVEMNAFRQRIDHLQDIYARKCVEVPPPPGLPTYEPYPTYQPPPSYQQY